MKKRSKLFLLVAGIIFAVGIIICLVGVGVSSSTGEQIYSSKIGEDRGYTYSFKGIDKIKINVTDADINIYTGSKNSYIEVLNFNENLCSYTSNNAMITFRETAAVEDITGIWESGLSFKGLRYILRPVPSDKKKSVNIYLSEEEHIKAFDIKLENGNVSVSGVATLSDYSVTLESGKIAFSDVKTESSIDIKATGDMSTDITFTNVSADMMTLDAKRAKFIAEGFSGNECDMKVSAGSATFDFVPKADIYTVDISTKGKLTVDGQVYLDRYKYPEEELAPPEDGEEELEVSTLVIAGDDFTVSLDTPAEISEETENN